MPATIYAPPLDVGDPPELDYLMREGETIDDVLAPEREWEETLRAWVIANGKGALRGEEIRFPRGDGYARYFVYTEKPLALIHIPTGDAWDIDDVMRRGLRLSDVRDMVAREKKLAEIFGQSKRREAAADA